MTKQRISTITIISLLFILLVGCQSTELTSAKMYIQQQDWNNAEKFLLDAMVVEPDNPEIPFLLAHEIYARNLDWDKMSEMHEKALSIDPNRPILQGNSVKDYVAQSREQHWVTIYNKGVSSFNQYRNSGEGPESEYLQEAIEIFTIATNVDPNNGQAYSILANCLLASGDLEGALDAVIEGAGKDPGNFEINMAAGKMLAAADDKESALIYYKKAVDINPQDSMARRQLAQTYYDVGDKEMSLATYEIAIANETDPNLKADLYYNLGVLNMQLEDFQAAEDNFSMAYDLNPDDIDALRGIAQTFESAEEWGRAEYYYRKLIDIEPENPQHYRAMARVLLRQGDTDEAQEYFDRSKDL
jgi:tetratricopeptide (TPR) repeat protein